MDYDVISVYLRKRATWSKKVVHGTLKSTGGVAQPKRHDFELVRSEFGPKSSTGNIFRKDSNLVITLRQVYFAEKLRSFHAIKYFINQGKRILVFLRYLVEGTVVNAKPLRSIFLSCEVDTIPKRASGRLNLTCAKVNFQLPFQFSLLSRTHAINAMCWWFGTRSG